MVNLTIDGKKVSVPGQTTIMEAAESVGIHIPRLCYLKDLNEIAACRVCVVEVDGKDKLITSCNNVVLEGMEVKTNSKKVRSHRKTTVELLLSQHSNKCVSCARNQNCSLQDLTYDLNIREIPYEEHLEKQEWNNNFPLIRDSTRCIKCMRCIQVCDKMQSLNVWGLEGTGARTTVNVTGGRKIEDANCSLCGQCITHCPVGALSERDDTEKAWNALEDETKTVVVQVAPAVRASWAEQMGLSEEEAPVGKIFDALKKMGADYVFDTVFGADLTIMEEASEFLERFTAGDLKERPMFTSCCPGWVRFVKTEFPHMLSSLSTAKSPQQMFGAVMKSYFAEKIGKNPNDIVAISVMPCVAKKAEREMDMYYGEFAGHETDIVITTRELTRMIKSAHINVSNLENIPSDNPMEDGTGAGVIFGATGGVMEAALRTAYFTLKGENPPNDAFLRVRNDGSKDGSGIRESEFDIDGVKVKTAVVSGLGNTRELLERIDKGEANYDFVEVMACPGGCVGGGGQIIHDGQEKAFERGKKLYKLDDNYEYRCSHDNPDIKKLYDEYLGKPLSFKAHMLLHTEHKINN